MIKIDKKIVAQEVVTEKPFSVEDVKLPMKWHGSERRISVATKLDPRPKYLDSKSFKIKSGNFKNAFYVTVSWYKGKMFEIFINSANKGSAMWYKTITRMMSAVMRAEDDITLLLDEMMEIDDPMGFHWGANPESPQKQKC